MEAEKLDQIAKLIHEIRERLFGTCNLAAVRDVLRTHSSAGTYPYALLGSSQSDVAPGWRSFHQLSDVELAIAQKIGPMRTQAAREAKRTNMRQDDPKKEIENEINGLGAEILYGRLRNFFPGEQLTVRPRKMDEDCGDFTEGEFIIDVKYTNWRSGVLFVAPWKQKAIRQSRVDILVLFANAQESPGKQRLCGFFPAKKLLSPEYLRTMPHKPESEKFYLVYQHELMTLGAAKRLLREAIAT